MNDHDLLIELNERVKTVKTILCNHLKHHFAINMILLTSTLSLAAAILVLVIKK